MDCQEFHGVAFSQLTVDASKSQMPKVNSALIVCIQKRFSDIDAEIFKCTTIIQLDSSPSVTRKQLFGIESLWKLSQF